MGIEMNGQMMAFISISERDKVDLTKPIYHDNDAAREHLEGLLSPDGPVCPRCGVNGDRITKLKGKPIPKKAPVVALV